MEDELVEVKLTGEQGREISAKYPPHNDVKYERYLPRMERLVRFYEDKAEVAPLAQSYLFKGFIHALSYFITTAKMYRKLTRELKTKAEEANNETPDIQD